MKKFLASFTIIIFLTVFSFPNFASAAYFGGRLTGTFYCNCSNSLMLFIQDYASGGLKRFIYGPGSNLLVGSPYGLYQIGSYSGGGICLIYTGDSCKSLNNDGLIGGGSPGFGTSS